mmetsp:Transcript_15163/g.43501  ORF Transcript_15163/g.43501 Transcript_15163/m.43501 type:complete len:266 (-) Transcript_15163:105-902(-)
MPWGSCPCPGVKMRGSPPLDCSTYQRARLLASALSGLGLSARCDRICPRPAPSASADTSHCRSASHRTMAPAVATLIEFLTPNIGMLTTPSHASSTCVSTPISSLPRTRASGCGSAASRKSTERPGQVSAAHTATPRACNPRTVASVDGDRSCGTYSAAPSAVLSTDACGGAGVIPQRCTLSTRAASAARRSDPTLCALRMLSSTRVSGKRPGLAASASASVRSWLRSQVACSAFCSRWRKQTACATVASRPAFSAFASAPSDFG